jgi:uncharacterized protein VirK/YbjX
LNKILKSFGDLGFIARRTYYLYLYKYLSTSLDTEKRQKILINHYEFFKKNFPYHILRQIFRNGLVIWSETRGSDRYEIKLADAYPFEEEGCLSLIFHVNESPLYTISFTFCNGVFFGIVDDQVIYVTRIQGVRESLDKISDASKAYSDNALPVLLISALEGMAISLGIRTLVGVSLCNRVGNATIGENGFQKNYDEFWRTFESIRIAGGDYILSLPVPFKAISLIKSKHRSRVIAKRKIRQFISKKTYFFFMNEVLTGKKIRINGNLRVARENRAIA